MTLPAASSPDAGRADVTRRPLGLLAWYGLPIAAIFAAGYLLTDARILGVAWAAAFGVMGGKCLANALHCGRVHCYFTGPWFLLATMASLLHGFGLIPFEGVSWNLIGNLFLVGAALLWCGSEFVLGRYRPIGAGPRA
jgi:hypothetical protein